MHCLVFTCCSFQLLRHARQDTTKTNRMPVSSSTILHRFDTLQQCDQRVTKFTEESFVLTIVTQLPPTGTILSRSQLLKEEIATGFKDYLSTSLQFIYLLIVPVPVTLWINKPTSLLMNHHYPDMTGVFNDILVDSNIWSDIWCQDDFLSSIFRPASSRAASQRLGILVKSWRAFYDRLLLS